jgi:hypothetical protein
MKELATKIIKKISLEVIYDTVDERTIDIRADIAELKRRQEEDFRYTNQRIDALSQKIDAQGQRIDTVIQMLMDMSRQLLEIAKQK